MLPHVHWHSKKNGPALYTAPCAIRLTVEVQAFPLRRFPASDVVFVLVLAQEMWLRFTAVNHSFAVTAYVFTFLFVRSRIALDSPRGIVLHAHQALCDWNPPALLLV